MEAVVLDQEGKSNFQALQGALGDGGDTDAHRGLSCSTCCIWTAKI